MARGKLRIYLGAAPGVGKTFAMLDEGSRRAERGTDVIVGFVETHGRPRTVEQLRDLEIVPRRSIEYRGQMFEEMDLDAVLERRPEVVLVDELAHTNVPGSRNAKRHQDVNELLDAGIDVISTVNIQHLESLNDVVEQITGITQRETIPDAIVREAEQVELVDMTPEALRRRMAHGNIYAVDKVDAALGNYFRVGNLTALRELALLWVADQVDLALHEYRERHGIAEVWETRERVAVAITGAPGADDLIRRAARIATRSKAELIGIHVESSDGLASASRGELAAHRQLLLDLGGRYRDVVSADIGGALVATAIAEDATQLVLGASRRSRWTELTQGSVINKIAQQAGGALDVHIIAPRSAVTMDESPEGGEAPLEVTDHVRPPVRHRWWQRLMVSHLAPRRQLVGVIAALIGLPLLTMAMAPLRDELGFASVGFCYLLAIVIVGAVGGLWAALLAAVMGFFLMNWFFADPIHTFTIANERDGIALVAFLLVSAIVSFLVERSARRSAEATKARAEAETLASMAAMVLRDDDPLDDLVAALYRTFDIDGVSVLRLTDGDWVIEASAGTAAPRRPDDAELALPLADDVSLAVAGGRLTSADRRVLDAFATHLSVALESRRMRTESAQVAALAKAYDLRNTILAAVSHDLRTPLTTIKTSASVLLDAELEIEPDERRELLDTIDHESDRLNTLVGNLLDLGRLQSEALSAELRTTDLGEVIATALADVAGQADVSVELLGHEVAVHADPVLLERSVANLVANAIKYSPEGSPVTVRVVDADDRVEVRVIDHGPGIPREERERVFGAFERLDGSPEGLGVGLGLAVARGFLRAMDGDLVATETPGGGTTMVATLRTVRP